MADAGFIGWIKELAARAEHDVGLVLGKKSAESVGGAIAGTHGVLTIPTLGLAAAVSAGLTQIEYNRKTKEIRDLYKEEVSAQLGKSEKEVSKRDVNTLAVGDAARGVNANKVIAEAVNKEKAIRTIGIAVSIAATVAALSIAQYAAAAGIIATAGKLGIIASMATGLVAYNLIKAPLNWASKKIFGLEKQTAHERITSMSREREAGKTISREQVFSVFTSANPELDAMIAAQFGERFADMKLADKQKITDTIGKLLHVDALTNDINQGRIKVTELAFAVQGDVSGVVPKAEAKPETPGVFGTITSGIKSVVKYIKRKPDGTQISETIVDVKPVTTVVEYEHEKPVVSFVERLGRGKPTTQLGYVERIEQSRSEPLQTQR